MDYRVLPGCFVSSSDPFRSLPAEMVSTIFRYLDADSLLSVYSTSRRFRDICLHDPMLTRKLTSRTTELRREERRRLLNPKFGVSIVRNDDFSRSSFRENTTQNKVLVQTRTQRTRALTIPRNWSLCSSEQKVKTNHRPMRL